jgi:CIC family chloride channel protein
LSIYRSNVIVLSKASLRMKFLFNKQSKIFKASLLLLRALIVGVIGGLGGVVYILLIGIVFNFVFLGHFGYIYHWSGHPPMSRWGFGVILVPLLGGLPVVWLIKHFGNNERGISEPEIMHFIHPQEGKKRYLIELSKSLASVITIGTGGSVGGEIPLVQLGATLSHLLGKFTHRPAHQRLVLIAAGAAASLGAVFNAPFTGVMFAIEILLFSFNISHFILILISALVGGFVGDLVFGSGSILNFRMIPAENFNVLIKQLILYVPFAILIGLSAAILIKGIRWFKILFEKKIANPYIRHSIGMGLLGIMVYLLMKNFGQYYTATMGFATINDIINYSLQNIGLLLLIFSCKIFALCLTFGSGASGGIFSPSLLLGALLGAAYGLICQHYFPHMQINILYFVLAGIAGMLSSVTGAILTSLVFIFELSRNYHIALPVLITVIIGTGIRLLLCPKGIYTYKLYQHGMMFKLKL